MRSPLQESSESESPDGHEGGGTDGDSTTSVRPHVRGADADADGGGVGPLRQPAEVGALREVATAVGGLSALAPLGKENDSAAEKRKRRKALPLPPNGAGVGLAALPAAAIAVVAAPIVPSPTSSAPRTVRVCRQKFTIEDALVPTPARLKRECV